MAGAELGCRGGGRPVAMELGRSYLRCPNCSRRFHVDACEKAPHPYPRYHHAILPAHEPRKEA